MNLFHTLEMHGMRQKVDHHPAALFLLCLGLIQSKGMLHRHSRHERIDQSWFIVRHHCMVNVHLTVLQAAHVIQTAQTDERKTRSPQLTVDLNAVLLLLRIPTRAQSPYVNRCLAGEASANGGRKAQDSASIHRTQ